MMQAPGPKLRRTRASRWALAGITLCAAATAAEPEAAAAAAEPAAASPSAVAERAQAGSSPVLETSRRSVRAATEWMARGVDSWFGNRPFEEGGQVADGRLSVGLLKRQHESLDTTVRFKVHLRLPNAERFGYLFIGRDDPRDVVTDTPTALSNSQKLAPERARQPSFLAGVGLSFRDVVDLRLGFRGGLKPYAQASTATAWKWGDGPEFDLRETVFWAREDRLGSTTALSVEQALSANLALRWLSAATITQAQPHVDWTSSLGAYQSFGQQRLLSLELLVNGIQGSGVLFADQGLQVKWEQPVYRNWLLLELLAGHFWPRPDVLLARDSVWALGARLQMRF